MEQLNHPMWFPLCTQADRCILAKKKLTNNWSVYCTTISGNVTTHLFVDCQYIYPAIPIATWLCLKDKKFCYPFSTVSVKMLLIAAAQTSIMLAIAYLIANTFKLIFHSNLKCKKAIFNEIPSYLWVYHLWYLLRAHKVLGCMAKERMKDKKNIFSHFQFRTFMHIGTKIVINFVSW